MKKIFSYLFAILTLLGCESRNLSVDISSIDEKTNVKRYDQALFEQDLDQLQDTLNELAQEYPLFLSKNLSQGEIDGLIEYILNPLNQKLYLKSVAVHDDFKANSEGLQSGLQHFKYYFPEERAPVVYTYISGLNYMEPIICNDTVIVIGLDMFLGSSYEEYRREKIPLYISKKYDPKYIPTAALRAYALAIFGDYLSGESMLEYMICLGKIEYFVKAMYPETQDSLRFAFSPEQMEWCNFKEKIFWEYLANKKLLFSKDHQEFKKYIEDQPFISSMERASPGRAAVWIGYRIVEAYMNNNPDVELVDLMTNQNQMEIYQKSKYKPQ